MKKQGVLLAAIAIGLYLCSGPAYAQGAGRGKNNGEFGKGRAAKWQNICSELNLTDEQKQKVEDVKSGKQDRMKTLYARLKEQRQALKEKLAEPNSVKTDVVSIAGEISRLETEILNARIDHLFAMKEILTPEQFTMFNEKMKSSFKGRMGKYRKDCPIAGEKADEVTGEAAPAAE